MIEARLVDHGPGTEKYYFFNWVARDPDTGAVLLRQIQICVHPQTGDVISYLSQDGGEVEISTLPAIAHEKTVRRALEAIAGRFSDPQVVEAVLCVSTDHGAQRLIWMVIIEEGDPVDWTHRPYVELDAQTGEILHVGT